MISANEATAIYPQFNMEVQIIVFGFFLMMVNGARIQRDAEDDCAHLPENTEDVICCEMPRRHLWGKIRETIHFCGDKLRDTIAEEGESPPPPTPEEDHGHHKRYSFRRNVHDGCFMECLFEKEGFIVDNAVNKEALLERVKTSQEGDDEWQATALAAVEHCVTGDIEVNANETCKSGSAEVVRCIFKHMFLECPTWLEGNEYCTSLKEFYARCPNGPPPDVHFKRHHHPHHHPHHRRHHHEEPEEAPEDEAVPEKPEEL